MRAARWLEEKILEVGPDKVAAFIAEPVQGAGGVIIPPATYWPEIQRIVDKYGILLVSDEVICAFGRLGQGWMGIGRPGQSHLGALDNGSAGIQPSLEGIDLGFTDAALEAGNILDGGLIKSVEVVELLQSGRD